ncbi:MAG: chemotaxis protein CheR [Ignavibacteriales bacterium]|nr:chemotaxis protein CheR [Ignavibacteriales bacterium]
MDLKSFNRFEIPDPRTRSCLKITEFNRLSTEINKLCGIKLPDSKLVMVEGRLRRRVKVLGLETFEEYVKYLFSETGAKHEMVPLIDAITTNKTDFFRENAHFEFLRSAVLPEVEKLQRNIFLAWSAGCSTGEEPYSLAIVLSEYFEKSKMHSFSIFASDISTEALNKAIDAIYSLECIEVIPMDLKKKYLMKYKDPAKPQARVCPGIRSLVNFSRVNLIEDEYDVPGDLDVVFCRNVLIYFDKATQEKVLGRISAKLRTGGYLFLGHSESILGMNLPLKRAAMTVYKKV